MTAIFLSERNEEAHKNKEELRKYKKTLIGLLYVEVTTTKLGKKTIREIPIEKFIMTEPGSVVKYFKYGSEGKIYLTKKQLKDEQRKRETI